MQLGFGYPNDTVTGAPSLRSDVTRVVVDFGLPLQGYTDIDDRYDEQVGKIESFLKRAKTLLDDNDGIEGMDVRFINGFLVRLLLLAKPYSIDNPCCLYSCQSTFSKSSFGTPRL